LEHLQTPVEQARSAVTLSGLTRKATVGGVRDDLHGRSSQVDSSS
jgi:hypothetical protein